MRLTGLEVSNVKRIKMVRLKPDGSLVIVKGANGQGKSSCIDSIEYLFGGVKTHPPEVIRRGETEARIVGETEELIATRRFWKNDAGVECTEVEVRAKADGQELKSPQKVLDKLFNSTAFDPVEYTRKKPAEQAEILRKLAGVDTTSLDAQHAKVFAERTLTNHEAKSAETRLAAMTAEAPPPPIDTSALLKERGAVTNAQQWARQAATERDAGMRRVKDCKEAVHVAEQALAQAKIRLETATKQAAEADNVADDAEEKAEGAEAKLAALDQLLQKASAVATANAKWAEREKLVAELKTAKEKAANQTTVLNTIDGQKVALVRAAKFPVPGLGFSVEGVTFNDLPLEQASGAQKLRISVAIATALNPRLRVMLVREGSLLDADSLALLETLCEENDMQCFCEMVGTEGPASVVFVDGEARS